MSQLIFLIGLTYAPYAIAILVVILFLSSVYESIVEFVNEYYGAKQDAYWRDIVQKRRQNNFDLLTQLRGKGIAVNELTLELVWRYQSDGKSNSEIIDLFVQDKERQSNLAAIQENEIIELEGPEIYQKNYAYVLDEEVVYTLDMLTEEEKERVIRIHKNDIELYLNLEEENI